jgi:hypothetical protein
MQKDINLYEAKPSMFSHRRIPGIPSVSLINQRAPPTKTPRGSDSAWQCTSIVEGAPGRVSQTWFPSHATVVPLWRSPGLRWSGERTSSWEKGLIRPSSVLCRCVTRDCACFCRPICNHLFVIHNRVKRITRLCTKREQGRRQITG